MGEAVREQVRGVVYEHKATRRPYIFVLIAIDELIKTTYLGVLRNVDLSRAPQK